MNININNVKSIVPNNYGWLEYKLSDKEMDYVWRCIDNKKGDVKYQLAGNITGSYALVDKSDWFYSNVIKDLTLIYAEAFDNIGDSVPVNQQHPYHMLAWWVNYQNQTEFNPLHKHTGVYSFVLWMKIPTSFEYQKKNKIALTSNNNSISNFQFHYINTVGDKSSYTYGMTPEQEGTLVLFPSRIWHGVYPFYDCDETRISVSGNIVLNTTKIL